MSEAILFLDVDGVLNHRETFGNGRPHLCRKAVDRLCLVVEQTGCRVVLSSTWRTMDGAVAELKAFGGFPSPHEDWRTIEQPFIVKNGLIVGSAMRGHEIAEWLSRHPEVERYAIVDDDSDMLDEQKPFFVQTSFETGLLDEHAAQLVSRLTASL